MDDEDRTAIEKRRNRLIALALSGATIAAGATLGGCEPCLSPAYDSGGNEEDAGNEEPDAGTDGGP